MSTERDEELLLELPPNSVDAHLIEHLYRNPECVYSLTELVNEIDVSANKTTNALDRLHTEGLIKKLSDRQYQALNDHDDLRRFAGNMSQLRSLFDRWSNDDTNT